MFSTSTILIASLLPIVFVYLLIYFLKRRHIARVVDKIPGPPSVPIFGNTLELAKHNANYSKVLLDHSKTWPKLFRYWIGSNPFIFIYHYDTVEAILASSVDTTKARPYDFMVPWLGTGLLNSDGAKWKTRRKMLTPTFHFRILQDFISIFNEQSEILIKIFSKQTGKPIDIFPLITNCTLDIICDSAMGRHVNAQGNDASDYVKATDRIKCIITRRQLYPWLQSDFIYNLTKDSREHKWCLNLLHSFTEKVIEEKKAKWQPKEKTEMENDENVVFGKKKRLAFLDLLLDISDGGRVLSNSDIREEVDTFMFEGHDTTAAAISWAMYLLGHYPEAQKKVHAELDDIFGSDNARPVSSDDLARMNYLECVIKETLRIYPSVPIFGRLLKRDIKIDGYTIPATSTVIVAPYLLHRNPEVFPRPDVFDPDRFLPENNTKRHPFAYIPFSAGPRNCIGQKFAILEEKVVLSYIFRSFHVRSLEPEDKLVLIPEMILKSDTGINVCITPRK